MPPNISQILKTEQRGACEKCLPDKTLKVFMAVSVELKYVV